ncbi:UBIQUITIN-ASSOCIATED (UBA) PROTEIN-RELATED [Salix viminalis]|uniref:UBIQUITIN-ASSOCIATED (UBA) PROTEIN-RELATED n=1 Tax=Salix viminalis TaxID=40686 RepID=A0A9Q0NVG8_SALVM|nr:UBIQUITIN-ASSOCIATED (UBA) PROTEIN-RELATED [Salix viminalis]
MSWLMRESSRATREVSSNGIVRRMVNLPRSIAGGFSRVMSHGIGRIGIAEEWTFLSVYEQQYGTTHPLFYTCQFMEALKIAEDEHKFMFMYLHSPQHPFTPSFCWGTLGSELVVQFLDANFVCWGALSDRGEGSQMAVTLQPASFPCCAVIAPAAGNSIAVLQQMEGPISPAELVEILQRTVEEQGLAFGNSRAKEEETTREKAMEEERKGARAKEEEKIRADRQLREEQDAAYLSALKIDKVKRKKLNSLLPERKFQRPAGSSSKANYEKLRQNPSQKQFGKSKEVSTVIETANGSKDSQATQILIRFPNGVGNYRLISSFPRRVYSVDQMGLTLKDAGLHPKSTLFLELL